MVEALKVMTYFKVSLSTHNWDRAFSFAVDGASGAGIVGLRG
jgi:hypothetical protein